MSRPNTATLLLRCPDQKGLNAAIANLLVRHNINILDAQQHTDEEAGIFFHRVYFDVVGMAASRDQLQKELAEECARYGMEWRLSFAEQKKRVAIFVSKYEHCIYDLLLRHKVGELNCDIPLIISNHEDLRYFADVFKIPYFVFPINKDNKHEQELKEIALLQEYNIDLIVMARYMQVLSDSMINCFPNRIINIHHSTLPAFKGAKPYHQAFERGVKLVGATAHYATADLDEGPIIAQGVEGSSHEDTIEDLVRKGRDIERVTLAQAVRAHLDDKIIVYGHRTIVF
ncbi:MAG: formyltetrahydrofolate deformylase [Cellvibrionales bacterium]|jgi:formyltetrahydrofolate deformylase|nr:formyltetrahydrofolate deformylase [Cellvibrionales bacterium]